MAGRYRLLDQVGSGGMGSVWRAHDLRTGQDVALKVLGRHSSTLLARFVREQAVRVRHPHVVAPHGWAAEDDLVVLAMELVAGGSVADLLREHGPLDAGTCALLVEQLLLGLAAVHAAGLVHRDVKPANVLVGDDGRVRLTDFGIARLVDAARVTSTGMMVGTASYLAPEQVAGEPVGPPADVYALGLVLLECLTAQREYAGSTVEVALARLHRAPQVPATLPAGWPGLLRAMTARDPAARPTPARAAAESAVDVFVETYAATYPQAAECLTKDQDAPLAFP